ncbi:PiggyBac transposable element-derived protein 4-like [Plakobranchus ocellatus]|uniref:PiggyBac transposable element-derived protein 4-like n=1 Tax=Plakobranchus ocellatus TaxID=259542 RepID=A0AAV4C7D0_9GAST|nr:PiggyBac transposable element-derived protein 4-like [Plakobranchus ocellatus]
MGMLPIPTLKDYWTWHVALHSSFCFNVMERDRFLSILAIFHIADNSTFVPFGEPDHDPIHKIRPFVDHLNRVFKELYEPDREVCLDEAMVPFKGRSRFKVYMKNKPTIWGFKLYKLCESKTGYIYTLEMYCPDRRLSNKAVDVTMRLMQPLLNKGHHLFVHNYYCCPELWDRLKSFQTALVGTCCRNRIGMPCDLFEDRQRPGDLDYRRKGQLIITRWMDKREHPDYDSPKHSPQAALTLSQVVKDLIVSLASIKDTTAEAEDVIHLPLIRLIRKSRCQCKVRCDKAKSRGMSAAERKKNPSADHILVPKVQRRALSKSLL